MTPHDWFKARSQRFASLVRPAIRKLIDRGNITSEEFRSLRMNSYERDAMVPALSDEALLVVTEYALGQASRIPSPATTYENAIVGLYAPELLKRLRVALTPMKKEEA